MQSSIFRPRHLWLRLTRPLRQMHVAAGALVLVCLAQIPASAGAELRSANPESAGFSTTRLQRIDERMREAVRDGVMVGGHAVIARGGRIVYDQTWGMADREADRPMNRDAIYRIYSMSKPITSVALLMLYEEGHFLLGDPIAKYLPELAGLTVVETAEDGSLVTRDPARQPTIRDLLRHTAGMTYGLFSDTAVDGLYRDASLLQAPSLKEFTERLGTLPLLLDPGTRWHYSVSVDVQGRLIEAISGVPFGEFLRSRLFGPLDMRDTSFTVPSAKQSRLAQLYSPAGTTLDWNTPWQFTGETALVVADPELTRPYLDGSLFESGGGGLLSTARDYLRFALMLAQGGELDGVRILSPRTVAHLSSNHLTGIDNSGLWGMEGFGLGVGVIGDTAGKNGELGGSRAYGWGGAAGTDFWVDPDADIVGLFMIQSVPHQTSLSKLFRILSYQALVE